jgi:hypothetical protein
VLYGSPDLSLTTQTFCITAKEIVSSYTSSCSTGKLITIKCSFPATSNPSVSFIYTSPLGHNARKLSSHQIVQFETQWYIADISNITRIKCILTIGENISSKWMPCFWPKPFTNQSCNTIYSWHYRHILQPFYRNVAIWPPYCTKISGVAILWHGIRGKIY